MEPRNHTETTSGTLFFDNPDYFDRHKNLVLGTMAAVLVAGTLAALWVVRAKTAEQQASSELGATKPSTGMAVVADKYPGTMAAGQSLLLAGDSALKENKSEEAARLFERFIRENPKHPLLPSALAGLATAEEARGNQDAAALHYARLADAPAPTPRTADALLALARIHAAKGDTAKARQRADELMAKFPGSTRRHEAEEILASLPKN